MSIVRLITLGSVVNSLVLVLLWIDRVTRCALLIPLRTRRYIAGLGLDGALLSKAVGIEKSPTLAATIALFSALDMDILICFDVVRVLVGMA